MSTTHTAKLVWGCKVADGQQDEEEAWETRTGLEYFPVSNHPRCDGILGVEVLSAEGYAVVDLGEVTHAQKVFCKKVGTAEGWPFGEPALILMPDSY